MLRLAVLILLLANAGYYAWGQGWLAPMGLAPAAQTEPERLARQMRPEMLRLQPASAPAAGPASGPTSAPPAPAAPASAAAEPAAPAASHSAGDSERAASSAPAQAGAAAASAVAASATPTAPVRGECLQAGPLDEAQATAWRRAASVLPEGSWSLQNTPLSARWMVYMGRLADTDTVAKKRSELQALGVPYDRPGTAWEPGLSLGRYSTEEAAQRALADLARKGVRTARVVQERAPTPSYMLRLPAVDPALRTQLNGLRTALAGKPLQRCN